MMDINKALGMTSERPLQVGDWVALIDPQPEGLSQLTTDLLCKLEWPRRVTSIANPNAAFVDGFSYCCDRSRFRRVDPPRDEVAELREQLATVTRERDEARSDLEAIADAVQPNYSNDMQLVDEILIAIGSIQQGERELQAEAAAMRSAVELRLRSVSKVLDEGRVRQPNNQFVQDNVWHGWIRERQVLCALLNEEFPKAKGRELLDELRRKDNDLYIAREALGINIHDDHFTVEPDAKIFDSFGDAVDEAIKRVCESASETESKAKNERIRELENVRRLSSDAYEKISGAHADLERQLAEHKRDAELCRELRALLKLPSVTIGSDSRTLIIYTPRSFEIQDKFREIRDGGAK